ncbi:MAG: helix-turn-helix domain-containing protein [Polyangiaceae bacterium]
MTQAITVISEARDEARWVVARARIPEDLAPWVVSWVGYSERRPGLHRQRELPSGVVHLIFEFGPPLAISGSGGEVCRPRREQSFVVGLDDCFGLTEHAGEQAGVQVSLSPAAARRVLGMPLQLLTHQVVDVGALECFREARRFGDLDGWEERFGWLTAFLRRRLRLGNSRSDVAWAVERIRRSDGGVAVAQLAKELGFSRKHLATLFQDQVGLTPKRYAELTRFERLTQRIKASRGTSWAQLAVQLGFADQAHLSRSVRRFSGLTPRGLGALLEAPHLELFESR